MRLLGKLQRKISHSFSHLPLPGVPEHPRVELAGFSPPTLFSPTLSSSHPLPAVLQPPPSPLKPAAFPNSRCPRGEGAARGRDAPPAPRGGNAPAVTQRARLFRNGISRDFTPQTQPQLSLAQQKRDIKKKKKKSPDSGFSLVFIEPG